MPPDDELPPMSDADIEAMVRAQEEPTMFDLAALYKPQQLRRILDHRLIGQSEQKDIVSAWLYAHFRGYMPPPLLITGQTASGKTEMFRAIQDKFGEDVVKIWDASMITADGWSGSVKLSSLMKTLKPGAIIVLDEFDKLIKPAIGASGTNYSELLQHELLRLFDHDTMTFSDKKETVTIDTSTFSVAMTGAFSFISEDLSEREKRIGFGAEHAPRSRAIVAAARTVTVDNIIQAGMMPELAGRIGQIVALDKPTEKTFIEIGKKELRRLSRTINKTVEISPDALVMLARSAAGSGLGARYVKNKLAELTFRKIYEDPEADMYCLDQSDSHS